MQRVPHNDFGFWLKEFKYIKTNADVKKYYLDSASYVCYSINIRLDDEDNIVLTLPSKPPLDGLVDVYFGQQFSAQRNIDLHTKFYFDQDLTINRAGLYNTFSEATSDTGNTKIFRLEGDSIDEFYYRNGFSEVLPEIIEKIPALENFYDLYFGYARVQNFKPTLSPVKEYEAITSQIIANMDDSCFKWIKIVDGYYEALEDEDYKSSAMVIDYKMKLNVNKLKEWILTNFSDRLVDMISTISTRTIDFNFMFYPPSSTGMQLEDVPTITAPMGIIKTKVLRTVEFEIKRSLADNSQKVFEIYFIDNSTGESIYGDNSVESPMNFSLLTKKGILTLETIKLENGVFEDLSKLDFPTDKFIVRYAIKDDVSKYLANHLNYTILIKVTDLTSERRQ